MKEFHIYKDIRQRTNGEIYLGVVGPGAYRQVHLYPPFYGGDGHPTYGGWSGENAL